MALDPHRPGAFHSLLVHGTLEDHRAVLSRATSLLLPGGVVMWGVEASPETGNPPEQHFVQLVQELRQVGLKPLEQLTLEPYFKNSAVIVAKVRRK